MKKISKYLLAFYFLIRLGALTPIIEIIGPYKTQEKCQEWASSDKFKDLVIIVNGQTCYEGSQNE